MCTHTHALTQTHTHTHARTHPRAHIHTHTHKKRRQDLTETQCCIYFHDAICVLFPVSKKNNMNSGMQTAWTKGFNLMTHEERKKSLYTTVYPLLKKQTHLVTVKCKICILHASKGLQIGCNQQSMVISFSVTADWKNNPKQTKIEKLSPNEQNLIKQTKKLWNKSHP